jgi:hypothetical protein
VDYHELIAVVLWAALAFCVVAAVFGVKLARRGQRNTALGLLLMAALGTSAFSLIAGFSVGRFTALVPVLLTGYVIAMDRGWLLTAAALVAAIAAYVACSWMLTVLVFQGGIFQLIFGAWAIPVYALAALAAYGWSLTHPPAQRHSGSSHG